MKMKIFFEVHEDNLDILSRTKEINLHILGQMMPILETFLQMNEEGGDEAVDSTNVPVERVFEVVNYAKKAFSTHLQSIGSAKLEETITRKDQKLRNGSRRTICKPSRCCTKSP